MKPGSARLLVNVTCSELGIPAPHLLFLRERPDVAAHTDAFTIKFYGEPTRADVLHEIGHYVQNLLEGATVANERFLDAAARGWS